MTVDEARELVSNRSLWPRIRDFLWDFAPQIHESWLECLTQRCRGAESAGDSDAYSITAAMRDAKGHPRVKAWLLKELGVETCFHAFPKEDLSRLLLLDGATIEEIAKWLGALACAEELRHVTSGATVRALKAELHGIYPEVFGYTAYFNGLAAKSAKAAKTPEEIVAIGFKMLFSQLAELPKPLVARLKFKLPKSLCELCVLCGKGECAVSRSVILKLLKLKFPEAYKICCS